MFEILENYDVKKVREEVARQKDISFVRILSNLGHTVEEISKVTGITIDRIKEILGNK